jgi:hypothetical protein
LKSTPPFSDDPSPVIDRIQLVSLSEIWDGLSRYRPARREYVGENQGCLSALEGILAYFDSQLTSAPTEAGNGAIAL